MNANATSVFEDPDVAKSLSTRHDKYVVVPADKAQNNIGLHYNSSDKTYSATTFSKEEIVENHKSVLSSFSLSTKDEGICTGFPNSTRIHTNNVR